MPIASVNGQEIFYEDSGGDKPVIAFSHGLLMDGSMFNQQVEALKGQYRCITWDERGHGQTAKDKLDPFTYYDSADDLAQLLRFLKIDSAVLAGMSQGGFLSLRCALKHPDLVRALILIDTQAGQEDPAKMPGYQQMIGTWTQHGLLPELGKTVAGIVIGASPAAAKHCEEWIAKWQNWKPANLLGAFTTLSERDDIHDQLGKISVPALIIHGTDDIAIPEDKARKLESGLTNASLVLIKDAGHASNVTHALEVNTAIESFLAKLPALSKAGS